MANEIFIDSSGFFAMLASDDDRHTAAARIVATARKRNRRFVTTDHVLDETATLIKARRKPHLLNELFNRALRSAVCRIEWTDSGRFQNVCAFFLKRLDQEWSFTECLSFVVMSDLRLREALTKDQDFEKAGFTALLL